MYPSQENQRASYRASLYKGNIMIISKMAVWRILLLVIQLIGVYGINYFTYKKQSLCNLRDRINNNCYVYRLKGSALECALNCAANPACSKFIFSKDADNCYIPSGCSFTPACSVFDPDLMLYTSDLDTVTEQAPIETTQNLIETTQNIIETTQNPIETTQNPIETTQNLIETTQNLIETTQNPIETTQNPIETTQNPIETTQKLIETTQNPIETTQNPIETTQNLIETTQNPIETTQNPTETTQNPIETTQNPIETTQDPIETTQDPIETTQNPIETTQNLNKTTQNPIETTQNPIETTQNPIETTQNLIETTQNPIETTQNLIKTTQNPIETTQNPIETTQNLIETTQNPPENGGTTHDLHATQCKNGGLFSIGACLCQFAGTVGSFCERNPTSCSELVSSGYPDGEYTVTLDVIGDGSKLVKTQCTIGSGFAWRDLLRNSGNFDVTYGFDDYETGYFLGPNDFFIGLENMLPLLSSGKEVSFYINYNSASLYGPAWITYTNLRLIKKNNHDYEFNQDQGSDVTGNFIYPGTSDLGVAPNMKSLESISILHFLSRQVVRLAPIAAGGTTQKDVLL